MSVSTCQHYTHVAWLLREPSCIPKTLAGSSILYPDAIASVPNFGDNLQDEMMQELLPFGEYIPPERFQPAQQLYMGLEAWELERILARLAVTNGATTFGPVRRRGQAQAEPLTVHAQHAPGQLINIQHQHMSIHASVVALVLHSSSGHGHVLFDLCNLDAAAPHL